MCLQNTWGLLLASVEGASELLPFSADEGAPDQSLSGKTLRLIKSTTRTTKNKSTWPAVIYRIRKRCLPPKHPFFFYHKPRFFDSSLHVMVFPFLIVWLTVFWKCSNERWQTLQLCGSSLLDYSFNWAALGQRTTWANELKIVQSCLGTTWSSGGIWTLQSTKASIVPSYTCPFCHNSGKGGDKLNLHLKW